MHATSYRKMEELLKKYIANPTGRYVCDIGAKDINGSYRSVVEKFGFAKYIGVDISEGPNVDMKIMEWQDKLSSICSVLISGQCLEHVKDPFKWMKLYSQLLLRDGIMIVIAPWQFQEHRFPIDCWRILPDGMRAVLQSVNLEVLEVGKDDKGVDCWGVGRKLK